MRYSVVGVDMRQQLEKFRGGKPVSMQYSSNSDAAMRAIIRSRPTLVGQYRQAQLEIHRRSQDLQAVTFQLRREQIDLEMARLEVAKAREECGTGIDAEIAQCRQEKAAIDAEEIEFKIKTTSKLAADTEREIRVCQDELSKILEEGRSLLGVDLSQINEAGFQTLMAEEFNAKRSRFFASQFLSTYTGLQPGVIEELLEMPESDRIQILEMQKTYTEGFLAFLPQAQPE